MLNYVPITAISALKEHFYFKDNIVKKVKKLKI